jgi:hypothetical protein
MIGVTQARQRQFEEQYLRPDVDQGEGLGLGFEGPGRQGLTRAAAARQQERAAGFLEGEDTRTERQKQHDRATQMAHDREAAAQGNRLQAREETREAFETQQELAGAGLGAGGGFQMPLSREEQRKRSPFTAEDREMIRANSPDRQAEHRKEFEAHQQQKKNEEAMYREGSSPAGSIDSE